MSSINRERYDMRIAFVWDWEPSYYQTLTWQDGLAAAVKVLSERHTVQILTSGLRNIVKHPYFDIQVSDNIVKDVSEFNPDVILHWADFTRPHAIPLAELGIPMAICFAGGEAVTGHTELFDHIFIESAVYKQQLVDKGFHNVSTAFGTNTDLFKPVNGQPKIYDTIFPGTFAAWKRHEIYARAVDGLQALACGYMYDDHEQECWGVCLAHGVQVLPHISAEALRYLYAASRICVVTSESGGGSQRTVLEAMAMNIPVIVTDSDKFDFAKGHVYETDPTPESIRGYINAILDGEQEVNTREYVLQNWSHMNYASALERGLQAIL